MLEQFSIEYHKTKLITLTNQSEQTQTVQRTNQHSKHIPHTYNQRQARENLCEQDAFGFRFASHWLRKWA